MARILLVDDEEGMRHTLSEFLREDDHHVDMAQNVPEAMKMLEHNDVDVVVSDIIMPKVSGIELMHHVQQNYPDIQIILVTGGPTVDTAAEAVRAGAFDYLTKPVSRKRISEVVGQAVRLKQLADENRRLDAENRRYRDHLEEMVALKTRELVQREELFRIITTSAHDAVLMMDNKGRITFWNDAAEKLFGYSAVEATKIPYYDLIVQEPFRETIRRKLPEYSITGNARVVDASMEVRGMCKDGRQIPLELAISSVKVQNDWHSVGIARDLSFRKQEERHHRAMVDSLKESLYGVVEAMSLTVETRDPYTAGHQHRVASIARSIARHMGLPDDQVEGIGIAATIHDIGKLSVPAEILSKPGSLTIMEFDIIKQHAVVGYSILKTISLPWPVAETILQHHERFDGSGYPNGLKGDDISLEARILMVADVVEAISSHRPYRAALGEDAAIAEITENRGILYDPRVVDSCVELHDSGTLIPVQKESAA